MTVQDEQAPLPAFPLRPLFWRAVIILCAWLPSIAFVAFYLPHFVPIFEKRREKGELPTFNGWVLELERLGAVGTGIVGFGIVAALVAVDVIAARRRAPALVRRSWFTVAVLGGLVSCWVLIDAVTLKFPPLQSTTH